MSSGDLRNWLEGTWAVTRSINDGAGRFEGAAHFTPVEDGLTWVERGNLELGGYRGPASRTLAIVAVGEGWEVRFDDGRPFHHLDPAGGVAEHRCGADVYRGDYRFHGADAMTVVWSVSGPGRRDVIRSEYLRRPTPVT